MWTGNWVTLIGWKEHSTADKYRFETTNSNARKVRKADNNLEETPFKLEWVQKDYKKY